MKKIFVVVFLFFSLSLFCQKFELGKVSVEELKEKRHPLDTAASAAVLYKKGTSYFDIEGVNWIIVTEVEVRLKIYTAEGFSYAQVAIPYNIGKGYNEKVIFSDAVTYNLSGNKVVKTKLDPNAQITEGADDAGKMRKIVLPNIKEGCIIEYKYTIKSKNLAIIPCWYFQDAMPVNKVQYSVCIPHRFSYNEVLNSSFLITESVATQNRPIKMEYSILKCAESKKIFAGNNIPALENKSNSKPASLRFERVSSSAVTDVDEARPVNWESVARSIYEDRDFGGELKKTSYFEKDLAEVIKGKILSEDKLAAIFNYVKNRMAWNRELGYTCEQNIEKAYAERTGNVAEINLMLIAMLRHEGFNASPVLSNTRNNSWAAIFGRNMMSYVMAGVEMQNKIILLDATSKNAGPNVLPVWALNDVGRLIRSGLSSMDVDISAQTSSLESITILANIGRDGFLTGQLKNKRYDYNALRFRDYNSDINKEPHIKEDYIREKEVALGNIEIEFYEVLNLEEDDKPVEEGFSFKAQDLCGLTEGKMYLSPMLMYTITENPFWEEERTDPLRFLYPYQDRYAISIVIPEEYKAEFIPQPVFIKADDICNFKYSVAVNGNKIQVSAYFNLLKTEIKPEYYDSLREFYALMIQKQAEKIVLVKKT